MNTDAISAYDGKRRQIIVSGATGFIGQHLIPALLNRNYRILVLGRDPAKLKAFPWHGLVEWVNHDLNQNVPDFSAEPNAGFIHLAWPGLLNYQSLVHFEKNLPNSYTLIKTLVERGVTQVLVTGTCLEYGLNSGPLSTDLPTNPHNPYALAKDTLRRSLEFLQMEQPFVLQWARLFYMYGPGQSPKAILSQLDAAIRDGASTFNMSGGEQLRDYLPVQRVAEKVADMFCRNANGIFNVCSGEPISIRRLVEDRIREKGASIRLNLGHYPYPDYEPMAFWGTPNKVPI